MLRLTRVWIIIFFVPFFVLGLLEVRHKVLWWQIELRTSTIVNGMTKDQVIARLGAPLSSVGHAPSGTLFYEYRAYQPIPFSSEPYAEVKFLHNIVRRVVIYPDADIRFDAADWRASDAPRRGCMVADLLSKFVFSGMTRSRIIELLGPPDREKDNTLSYDLGVRNGVDIEEDQLIFEVNESNVVINVNFIR